MLIVLSYFVTKIQNILYITKVFGKYFCRSVGTDLCTRGKKKRKTDFRFSILSFGEQIKELALDLLS